MHFHFDFSAVQILWTLTFAAILVLLVVLLGRDRARRFPWFTTSMVLIALRLLASRMLYGRLAPISMSTIFLTMALIAGLVNLLVLVELARRAFSRASRLAWTIATLILLTVGAAVLAAWGPWPALKSLAVDSTLSRLRLMQFAAQKLDLLVDVLTMQLCVLVVVAGRRFYAGFCSHAQQIVIGLSTAALAQVVVRGIWQLIAIHAAPQSQEEYQKIIGLQEKLYNASSAVFVAVLIWWIICLWLNEPGTAAPATSTAETIEASTPAPKDEQG